MLRRVMWFTGAGTVAGILTLSLSGAVSFSSIVVSYPFSGVIFAAIVTVTVATQDSSSSWNYAKIIRYCLGALVLALGAPCGLLVAVAVVRLLEMVTASREFGNILPSVVMPATAILVWALCLATFLKIVVLRWRTTWFLQAMVLAFMVFAFVAGADSVTKSLWQRSTFVPLFIIGEQVGFAVFLAIATGHRGPIQELVNG